MTREEAKKELSKMIFELGFEDNVDDKVYALNMAIKALSQEPCEDTVSIRKDVLKCRVGELVAYNVEWLKKHWQMEMDIVCGVKPCDDIISRKSIKQKLQEHHDFFVNAYGGFSNLPQNDKARVDEITNCIAMVVNEPSVTQKSGKWNEYYTSQKGNNVFNCKECGHTFVVMQGKDNMNFCPNCGVKMESEE